MGERKGLKLRMIIKEGRVMGVKKKGSGMNRPQWGVQCWGDEQFTLTVMICRGGSPNEVGKVVQVKGNENLLLKKNLDDDQSSWVKPRIL